MRLRIKFSKTGSMKFIGHLDVMRYFQKALRRMGADVAFSGGFSPHMLMSFAQPLGVGAESCGEYFDLEVHSCESTAEFQQRLNSCMVPEIRILQVIRIPEDKASKGMTLVSAADYRIAFRDPSMLPARWQDRIGEFLSQPSIVITKKGKKGDREVDIRPLIYKMEASGNELVLRISAGSKDNLKPELAAEAFGAFLGISFPEHSLQICREELCADAGKDGSRQFRPLGELGETIES